MLSTLILINYFVFIKITNKMWANYDYSQEPIIKVEFEKNISKEEDFNEFLKEWIKLYEQKKDFFFILDTRNVGLIKMKYVNKMVKFIKKMKLFEYQYLQKSIIIVDNTIIRYLLNIIFKLTKPLATVHIVSNKTILDDFNNIENKEQYYNIIETNINKISTVNP